MMPTSENSEVKNCAEFLSPRSKKWKGIDVHAESEQDGRQLLATLKEGLQMSNVLVLAGSGTSMGQTAGPSMGDLWHRCMATAAPGSSANGPRLSGEEIARKLSYSGNNIEDLLSRCELELRIKEDFDVASFVTFSKAQILEACSSFLKTPDIQLNTHEKLLRRLARRRARDPRVKVFTTNYDTCFETAAGRLGLVVMDGFSFSRPRRFDPKYFSYDVTRRTSYREDKATPLEGVFHLLKLHGSVTWERNGSAIEEREHPNPKDACLVYPQSGKYQQAFEQPHLELVSQYLSALREPNTCIFVVGFGFNDSHLSTPLMEAVKTNPHLKLVVVGPAAKVNVAGPPSPWTTLHSLSEDGEDVWFINAGFDQFVDLLPDLKASGSVDRLARELKNLIAGEQ
ncbi:MAG: SIR2 family protein [Deltaproteobacteria bacterium]|nr:SIR2 family protein [Deltaproteobacteria bacterium]